MLKKISIITCPTELTKDYLISKNIADVDKIFVLKKGHIVEPYIHLGIESIEYNSQVDTDPTDEINFDKIPKKTFVIYHGHHGDKAVKRADLIIPMSCFTEKEGIYVNLEGRPQISSQVKLPVEGVNHSWEFFKKLSKLFNLDAFSSLNNF